MMVWTAHRAAFKRGVPHRMPIRILRALQSQIVPRYNLSASGSCNRNRTKAAIAGRLRMKHRFGILSAIGFVLSLAAVGPAAAQQGQPALKPASPACMASAREILTMKNAAAMYVNAVPGIVQQTKQELIQANLQYQKDLDEVAVLVTKSFAGKEKEIGEGMAQIYCNEFSEQDLKDIVAFYKSPLGQKLLTNEPRAIQASMAYTNQWAQTFAETVNAQVRAEMRKRGKPI
jgi:hypothetical protein